MPPDPPKNASVRAEARIVAVKLRFPNNFSLFQQNLLEALNLTISVFCHVILVQKLILKEIYVFVDLFGNEKSML